MCINSTDSLIPLLGPSGGHNPSAARWCTVGVTNICGLEVLVVRRFTDDMSQGCLVSCNEEPSRCDPCVSPRGSSSVSDVVKRVIC